MCSHSAPLVSAQRFNPNREERVRDNADVSAAHQHLLRSVVPQFAAQLGLHSAPNTMPRHDTTRDGARAQRNTRGAVCRVCRASLAVGANAQPFAAVYSRSGKKLFLAPELCASCSQGQARVSSPSTARYHHGRDRQPTRAQKRCKQLLRQCWREYAEVMAGPALAMQMHRAGLNMRLLGHVSRHARDASIKRRLAVEMAARTLKNVLRRHLRRTLEAQSNHNSRVAVTEPFRLNLTHFLNSALVMCRTFSLLRVATTCYV